MSNAGAAAGLVLLLNRLALGGYFMLAGVDKVKGGLDKWMTSYKGMLPEWLPTAVGVPYGWFIPFGEIVFGALLIVGLFSRTSALVVTGMIGSFTVALWQANQLFAGPGPFHTNIILITLGLMLAMAGSGRFSVDAFVFGWKSRPVMKTAAAKA